MKIFIGVDVGGTFTDFTVRISGTNQQILYKVPSKPAQPDLAIVDGLRDLLSAHKLNASDIVRFAHGTTVGTNALIQRRVGKVALVTSDGFRDLLEIGRQVRPKVYDIHQDFPKPLVPRWLRYEVPERMRADGVVHTPLDEDSVLRVAREMTDEGVDCVAVCFLHSHAFPAHENRAKELLQSVLGNDVTVITSSLVYPEFREYERFSTTVLNAALLTVMNTYLDRFSTEIRSLGVNVEPTVSQSSGGLMSVGYTRNYPIRSALSGPAAGVLGVVHCAKAAGLKNIITLDIGGTSTDVSLLANSRPSMANNRRIAGFPLRLPAIDVNAVGAGGGSIAWIDLDGLLKVGPHSAGASPGPACYGQGGEEATVTDANVLLGRLPGESLLDGRVKIHYTLALESVDRLAVRLQMSREETAHGIIQVACATIVKAIRAISVERGHDPSAFALFCFGGAGPLHAADVARKLGIRQIVIPPNPGISCAEGLLGSDLVADMVHPLLESLDEAVLDPLNRAYGAMSRRADDWFKTEKIPPTDRQMEWAVDMRYAGQNFELSIPFDGMLFDAEKVTVLRAKFDAAHEHAYGFYHSDEPIEIVNMRIKLTAVLEKPKLPKFTTGVPAIPCGSREVSFRNEEWKDTPIFRRETLRYQQTLSGPAVIEQMDSMVLLFPGDQARVDEWGNLRIELKDEDAK